MAYKLGCLPNDPSKPRVRLRATADLPAPPASAGFYSAVPGASWGMLLNDQLGDCVAAGALHGEQLVQKVARGVDTGFTDNDALKMYEVIGGYVPGNPNTDQGATLQDGLNYWRTTGLGADGYKLEAFAEIDFHNLNLVKSAVALFGVVYAAFEVPQSALDQFDAGQPWDVARRSQIVGGHCVPIVGYDAQYLYVVTWGQVWKMTYRFYARYFEETWVPIDADWLEASGATPSGLDFATANADYQALTGDTASPFPSVTPPPGPTPTPAPTGDAVALLQKIAGEIDGFLHPSDPPHHGH